MEDPLYLGVSTRKKKHEASKTEKLTSNKNTARSKYDYKPTDPTEIPLTKNCLVGVLESDLSEESWWIGAVWDEYHQAWSNAGSVPGNFMVKL
jgi:hypothetical protein